MSHMTPISEATTINEQKDDQARSVEVMWNRLEVDWDRLKHKHKEAVFDPRPAALGDVFIWSPPNDLGIDWVVIGDHPDKPELVFVVPGDGFNIAGLCDVAVCQDNEETIYLRCGRGAWVLRKDLAPERRYRTIWPFYVERARSKIKQILRSQIDGSAAAWEAEENPDYKDWMEEVSQAVLERTS